MTDQTTRWQPAETNAKAAVPAFIPPGTPDPRGRCYICGGPIGVFTWTDCNGNAHPWCATDESWEYETNAR